MADISKCKGENCNIKGGCYRYTAEDDLDYQSWIRGRVTLDGEDCPDFWADSEESMRDQKKRRKERKDG